MIKNGIYRFYLPLFVILLVLFPLLYKSLLDFRSEFVEIVSAKASGVLQLYVANLIIGIGFALFTLIMVFIINKVNKLKIRCNILTIIVLILNIIIPILMFATDLNTSSTISYFLYTISLSPFYTEVLILLLIYNIYCKIKYNK